MTIQTPHGEVVEPAPRHAYFGGSIEGRPGSRAVLTVLDRGGVRGLVHDGSSWWRIGEIEDKAFGRQRPAAGSADPIDRCYGVQNGCYSGSPSLPAGCPGTGNNCGTIMSYCHLLPGGVGGNISLGLGTSSPYGVLPGRVPDRMASHVLTQAGANPGCLDHTVADLIFSDSFESGNASAWSARVP